jgi:hypothetical protein
MAEFRDLGELLDETLRLPIDGKVYVIAAPDAVTGLRVEALFAAGAVAAAGGTPKLPTILGDDDEDDLYQRVLGDTYQELLDDAVSHVALKLVATTAMMWTVFGVEVAETYWGRAGKTGEAPAPNRAARRAKKSTPTATVSATPKRGSTRTTKTSPTTSGRATPARASRGGRSSSAGAS